MFAYCENAPVLQKDPTGMNPFTDFFGSIGNAAMSWVNETNRRGWEAWENPSLYTVGDYLTHGLVSQTDKAWHPEEPFSAEHWGDSFWAAAGWTSYGVSVYGMAGGTTILNPGTLNLANVPTYGYGINFREANDVTKIITKGLSQAPKSSTPFSEYIQLNTKGNMISHTIYNDLGLPGQRLDLLRPHNGILPHLHVYGYNVNNQRNSAALYDMYGRRIK